MSVDYHLLREAGWSTVVINGTRQIPNRNFHGDALVPLPRIFPGRKDHKPKGLELVKLSKWNAHFPLGNSVWEFWSTFQEVPFSRENFHLHSILNFRIFWVNGKQPSFLRVETGLDTVCSM